MFKNKKNNNGARFVLLEFGLVFLVTGFVIGASILHYGLTNKQRWMIPPGYANDSFSILTIMKVAEIGEFHPFQSLNVSRLGAPYIANWDDFPATDPLLWSVGGYLSKLFGLEIASNLLLLLAHTLTAIVMYICLRWVSCNRLLSLVFSISFSLSPYLFHRGFSHIVLTFSESVPIICSICYMFYRHGPSCLNKFSFILICFTSFYIGLIFPYYTAVYLQVLLATLAVYLVTEKKLLPAWPYFLFFSLVLIGFFIQVSPSLIYSLDHGKNIFAVNRAYANLQVAALRPIELFLPGSTTHIPGLKQLSNFYENQDIFRKDFQYSESMAAYMGIVGCMAFFALVGTTVYQIVSKRQQAISGWFWFVLWFFALSVVGGLNGVVGLAKIYFFRSSNRMSVFILAGSLFFLALMLTKISRHWNRWVTGVMVVLIGVISIYEALPAPLFSPQSEHTVLNRVTSDKKFFQSLEKSLPQGAMIFNYPVIQYPESGTTAHLRPYIWSKNLRFSFGSIKGRVREQWQQEIKELPTAEMIRKLQEYGFAGILVYKGEELDSRELAEESATLAELEKLQLPTTHSLSDEFEFFKITPISKPILPPSKPFFSINWWGVDVQPQDNSIAVAATNGLQWAAQRNATIDIFNEQEQSREFKISGKIYSFKNATIQIKYNNKLLWSSSVPANRLVDFETQSELFKSGEARLEITSDADPVFIDGRKFSFGLSDFQPSWGLH